MQRLDNWDQFQKSFHRIKRNSSGYSSNLYAGRESIEDWMARGQFFCMPGTDASLFFRRDRDFYHLFHVAASSNALVSILHDMPDQLDVLTVDLVGTPVTLAPWTDAYCVGGFEPHSTLVRMSRNGPVSLPASGGESDVEVAGPDDAAPIVAFFERLLDRHAEQLPSTDDILREALQSRVLLVRQGAVPCGVLIFDLKGRSATLRYWHVDKHARGRGIGSRLMQQFLARCVDTARVALWVKANNAASISIYRYYGFETDSLIDDIMIKVPRGKHGQNS
jgi:ribosomal protein S18 acetylase RimI-like enzyme